MLWLNLIMDVLGAIALCTEPWVPGSMIPRTSRASSLLTPAVWKLILVQAAYQTVVLLVLMFFYGMMRFGANKVNLVTDAQRDKDGNATMRLQMDTLIFHVIFLMSLFNQFNCRNIDSKNLNPFTNLHNHY
jgi:Ca2+-transporting ATPase